MAAKPARLSRSLRTKKASLRNRIARAERLEPRLALSGGSLLAQFLASTSHAVTGTATSTPVAPAPAPAPVPVNQAPTVASQAAAASSIVTGASTELMVMGADDGGQAALTYTWSATTLPNGAKSPVLQREWQQRRQQHVGQL